MLVAFTVGRRGQITLPRIVREQLKLREGDKVTALSNRCTHLSCRVTWHEDRREYVCPCHDGYFDAVGKVVSGPPPRPLDPFQSKVENGQIMILLEA